MTTDDMPPMGELSVKYQLNHLGLANEVKELVSNYLVVTRGVTLLFGKEKDHKTILACQMALCMAMGVDCLTFSTVQGKVLYLTFEGGKPYLLARIEEMAKNIFPGQELEAMGMVGVEDLCGSQLEKDISPVHKLVTAYRPQYLFVDPIDLALAGDYSAPNVARQAMTNLIKLAEEAVLGVVAVTHSRKSRTGDFDDLIGSKMFTAMAASVIHLTNDKLKFEVRYDPPLRDLSIRFVEDKLAFEVDTPVLREGEKAEQALVGLLEEEGGRMTLKELRKEASDRAGVHGNTIDSARHRLEQKGVLWSERLPRSAAKVVILVKRTQSLEMF